MTLIPINGPHFIDIFPPGEPWKQNDVSSECKDSNLEYFFKKMLDALNINF